MRSLLLRSAVALTLSTGLVVAGAAVPAAASPALKGVTVHSLSNEDVAAMDRDLDAAQRLGANVVRVDIWWAALEPVAKGDYAAWYLDRIDRFFEAAAARGLKVLPTVLWSPCWASSAPTSVKQECAGGVVHAYPPANPGDYADFMSFLSTRYNSKLAGIEVWNEPNLAGFFKSDDQAADYAALARAAYPAIKQAAPGLTVVAGGLSGADRPFLERLYAHGIKGHYDALAIHPYNGANAPETIFSNPSWGFLQGVRHVRAGQLAAGDRAPLWITEFGWNTSTVRNGAPWANGVSDQTQANYLKRGFELLRAPSEGYVGAVISYNLRDSGSDRTAFGENTACSGATSARSPPMTPFAAPSLRRRPGRRQTSRARRRRPAGPPRPRHPLSRHRLSWHRVPWSDLHRRYAPGTESSAVVER